MTRSLFIYNCGRCYALLVDLMLFLSYELLLLEVPLAALFLL